MRKKPYIILTFRTLRFLSLRLALVVLISTPLLAPGPWAIANTGNLAAGGFKVAENASGLPGQLPIGECRQIFSRQSASNLTSDRSNLSANTLANPSAAANHDIQSHEVRSHYGQSYDVAGVGSRKSDFINALSSHDLESRPSLVTKLKSTINKWITGFSDIRRGAKHIFVEYWDEFWDYHTINLVWHLAVTHSIIDKEAEPLTEFVHASRRDYINNFYPILRELENQEVKILWWKFKDLRLLPKVIEKQIKSLKAPGRPIVFDIRNQDRRVKNFLFSHRNSIPIVLRNNDGELTRYFKKEKQIAVLGDEYSVPEYLELVMDTRTGMVRVSDHGEEFLLELIKIGEKPQNRNRTAFAVLDINNLGFTNYFKNGFTDGNAYIRAVAQIVRDNMRGEDFVFRLGGDELTLVLYDVTPEQARASIQRISDAVFRSTEANQVFTSEKTELLATLEKIIPCQALDELMEIATRHDGLNKTVMEPLLKVHWADQKIKPITAEDETLFFNKAKKQAIAFLAGNYKKVEHLKAGVTAGIVMIDEPIATDIAATNIASNVAAHGANSKISDTNAKANANAKKDSLTQQNKMKSIEQITQELLARDDEILEAYSAEGPVGDYVTATTALANEAKRYHKFRTSRPGSYDEKKYGPITEEQKATLPFDPDAAPVVLPPGKVLRPEMRQDSSNFSK